MYMYIAEEKTVRISFSPLHVYGRPWRIAFDMIYVRIGKYNFTLSIFISNSRIRYFTFIWSS